MNVNQAIKHLGIRLQNIERQKPSFGASQFEIDFHAADVNSLRMGIAAMRVEAELFKPCSAEMIHLPVKDVIGAKKRVKIEFAKKPARKAKR